MLRMKHFRQSGSHTCRCGKLLDAASTLGHRAPRPGDVTICFYCARLYRYTSDAAVLAVAELALEPIRLDDVDRVGLGPDNYQKLMKVRAIILARRPN